MLIGVIAIQGNVAEHVYALECAFAERGVHGEIVLIKHEGLVSGCDAIVLPGGESTTLARLMWEEGIAVEIKDAVGSGVPVLGTCAGLVLLAKRGDGEVARVKQRLLGIMDVVVKRNAFGRQYDSFEMSIDILGVGDGFPAVFIRAPAIVQWGDGVDVLARIGDYVVAAQQGSVLALAFHPEMVPDTRVHQYFIDMI
ncbi:MAG: pyridoxal 5'-phosphate synthase glutaminase subunit PdxT [Methanosarcinales archaeon]|nr:MAG: pyridoxal 5'-phosphate synthase glutaminase subunit PdxT [Methanosarcinales archaeon]